jgi:hypothetical protein
MIFTRSSAATDLTYIVQGSSDLAAWTDLPAALLAAQPPVPVLSLLVASGSSG